LCTLLIVQLSCAQSTRNNNNNNVRFADIVDEIIRRVIRNGRTNPNIEDIRTEINNRFLQLSIIDSFLNDETNFEAFNGVSFVLNDDGTRLTAGSFQQRIRQELDPLRRLIPQLDNATISNQIRQRIENIVRNGGRNGGRNSRTGSSIRLSNTMSLEDY
jgi:hypothetical protein